MWLILAAERFPQCVMSGSMCDIMAPNFDNMAKKPKFVEVYEAAVWRRDDMTLLEFLLSQIPMERSSTTSWKSTRNRSCRRCRGSAKKMIVHSQSIGKSY